MPDSIFELDRVFNLSSPFNSNWLTNDFKGNQTKDQKQKVQRYNNTDIQKLLAKNIEYQNELKATKSGYIDYYQKIGKLPKKPTEKQIDAVLTDANKNELKRLADLQNKSYALYNYAIEIEKHWNRLDTTIEDVVQDFNGRKKLSGKDRLDPNLVKALMFTESEMGTGADYKKIIDRVEKNEPAAKYQLNLGRVTDGYVYNDVVAEYNISVNPDTNYKAMGNKYDVMLAAGALIYKKDYALKISNKYYKPKDPWYNAIISFKGASKEGAGKADRVYKLYQTGQHPYTPNQQLF